MELPSYVKDAEVIPLKRFKIGVLAAGCVVAVMTAYFVSPFISLWRLQRAAEGNDTATLEELIDFPAVKASLKEQATGEMSGKTSSVLRVPTVTGFIMRALGPEVVNRAIDERATPAGVARLIKGAKIEHFSFTGLTEFTFRTQNITAAARFTGLGWRVFWVELPG